MFGKLPFPALSAISSSSLLVLIAFSPVAAEPPPVLKPMSVITLPPSNSEGLALAPDGQSVFHVEEVRHVNVWGLLAFHWPEWSVGLACIGGAAVGLTLWRRARLRRVWEPGEPYCRKCGYRLTGLTADRCPECGRDVTVPRSRIIAGPRWGTMRKRLLRLSMVGGACVLAYFPIRFAIGRDNLSPLQTKGRFHWDWRWLYRFAKSNDLQWILRHAEEVSVIVRRNVRDGTWLGEFEGRLGRGAYPLTLSPDGLTLWVSDSDMGLRSWDVGTGKLGKTLPWPAGKQGVYPYFAIGTQAAMAWSSASTSPSGVGFVAAWDLASGQPERIPPELQLESTLIAPLPDGVRILAEPAKVNPDEFGDILVVDRRSGKPVGPGVIHNRLTLDSPSLYVNPRISRDGKHIFPSSSWNMRWPLKGRRVRGWNIETGQALRPVGPFYGKDLVSVEAVPMNNGRRILTWKINTFGKKGSTFLQIDDVDQARTIAVLDMTPHVPETYYAIMFSADERTLIVRQDVPGPRRGIGRSFSVFDLSGVPPLE
jgi:hypothetical protein